MTSRTPFYLTVIAAALGLLCSATMAHAAIGPECESVCQDLDAIEDACEAQEGDEDAFCQEIDDVEELCGDQFEDEHEDDDGHEDDDEDDDEDEESSDPDAECPDVCNGVAWLAERCVTAKGAGNSVCVSLDGMMAGECNGAVASEYRANGTKACSIGEGSPRHSAGLVGLLSALLVAAAIRRK